MEKTWRLRRSSPDDGPDLLFGIGTHILGSSTDADLVVRDQTVSRRHARVVVSDRGVTIEDLGSTNGTTVDGKRIEGPMFIDGRTRGQVRRIEAVTRTHRCEETPHRNPMTRR